MDIARFITVAGLAALCALMIPIAIGAIVELMATLGAREMRARASQEPSRFSEPVRYPIRSSGIPSRRPAGPRVASLGDARDARGARRVA